MKLRVELANLVSNLRVAALFDKLAILPKNKNQVCLRKMMDWQNMKVSSKRGLKLGLIDHTY